MNFDFLLDCERSHNVSIIHIKLFILIYCLYNRKTFDLYIIFLLYYSSVTALFY